MINVVPTQLLLKLSRTILVNMEYEQVIQTCMDFPATNNGTIQRYVENTQPGVWQAEQTSNNVGDKNKTRLTISNEEHLLAYLSRFWDKDGNEQLG